MSTPDEIAMAYQLCAPGMENGCVCRRQSNGPCKNMLGIATEAIRLGAKLPDPRMERGRAAYECYRIATTSVSYSVPVWDAIAPSAHEAWARAAEAARAAP